MNRHRNGNEMQQKKSYELLNLFKKFKKTKQFLLKKSFDEIWFKGVKK